MTEEPVINAQEIVQKVIKAEQMLAQTELAAGQRIRAAVDAGEALSVAKEGMKHGEWIEWVQTNLGCIKVANEDGVTVRTTQNWMKLYAFYKANGDDIFDGVKSVRQAYKLAGIIHEVSSSGSKRASGTVDWRLHANRTDLFLRKIPVLSLSAEEAMAMLNGLQPIEQYCTNLRIHLSKLSGT